MKKDMPRAEDVIRDSAKVTFSLWIARRSIMTRRKKFGVKIGFRKPSLKKSFRKRKIKRTINPFYGKKGMGFIKNPRRSVRNKIYKKTTFGWRDIFKAFKGKKRRK